MAFENYYSHVGFSSTYKQTVNSVIFCIDHILGEFTAYIPDVIRYYVAHKSIKL